jgi:hypothetical protein
MHVVHVRPTLDFDDTNFFIFGRNAVTAIVVPRKRHLVVTTDFAVKFPQILV